VIPLSELLWRFGLAALFGFLLGLDREMRGISAGVRTHMLVALSSAMTMLIALELFEELNRVQFEICSLQGVGLATSASI
jgi:putative Mg2+ transporter-C (MgtC) family protein